MKENDRPFLSRTLVRMLLLLCRSGAGNKREVENDKVNDGIPKKEKNGVVRDK